MSDVVIESLSDLRSGPDVCAVPIAQMAPWFFWARTETLGLIEGQIVDRGDANARMQLAFNSLRDAEPAGTEWWMAPRRKMT